MNQKRLLITEIIGAAVIYLIAAFLHFFYELSSRTVLSSFLGSVNESVWEHLKIFSIAYALWAGVEYLAHKPPFKGFMVAKAAGVYSLLFMISGFFYLYTSFTKTSYAAMDIASSFVFTLVSQVISYLIITRWERAQEYFLVALFMWAFLFSCVLCLTYYPPELPLFRDPITGLYGVIPENIDRGAVMLSAFSENIPLMHQ